MGSYPAGCVLVGPVLRFIKLLILRFGYFRSTHHRPGRVPTLPFSAVHARCIGESEVSDTIDLSAQYSVLGREPVLGSTGRFSSGPFILAGLGWGGVLTV